MWHPLEKALPTTIKELLTVEKIENDEIPDHELYLDVLLATDSSGSHKQFQGKDIDIDSRNINVGKHFLVKSKESVASKASIFHSTRWLQTFSA